jgi:hypothetical protein
MSRAGEAAPLMARAVCVSARSQRRTGHGSPQLLVAMRNYRKHLTLQKLTEPEIAARFKAACARSRRTLRTSSHPTN